MPKRPVEFLQVLQFGSNGMDSLNSEGYDLLSVSLLTVRTILPRAIAKCLSFKYGRIKMGMSDQLIGLNKPHDS